jgi:hypothetical protein
VTEDEIISRGFQATRILADHEFMSFFDEMKEFIRQAAFNTEPAERDERERLYFQLRGIEDVLTSLNAYSAKAEEILAAHLQQTEVD